MNHLTAREVKAVLAYAHHVAAFLGLPRWRITLSDKPCGEDAHAEVARSGQRNLAELALCSEWMTLDADLQRDTITHEVLHLAHNRVTVVAQSDAARLMRKGDHRDWWRLMDRELELMVDTLAGALAETAELRRAWRETHA